MAPPCQDTWPHLAPPHRAPLLQRYKKDLSAEQRQVLKEVRAPCPTPPHMPAAPFACVCPGPGQTSMGTVQQASISSEYALWAPCSASKHLLGQQAQASKMLASSPCRAGKHGLLAAAQGGACPLPYAALLTVRLHSPLSPHPFPSSSPADALPTHLTSSPPLPPLSPPGYARPLVH